MLSEGWNKHVFLSSWLEIAETRGECSRIRMCFCVELRMQSASLPPSRTAMPGSAFFHPAAIYKTVQKLSVLLSKPREFLTFREQEHGEHRLAGGCRPKSDAERVPLMETVWLGS